MISCRLLVRSGRLNFRCPNAPTMSPTKKLLSMGAPKPLGQNWVDARESAKRNWQEPEDSGSICNNLRLQLITDLAIFVIMNRGSKTTAFDTGLLLFVATNCHRHRGATSEAAPCRAGPFPFDPRRTCAVDSS